VNWDDPSALRASGRWGRIHIADGTERMVMTQPSPHQMPTTSRPVRTVPWSRHLIVATLLGAALLLAACSSSGSATSTTKAPSTPSTATGSSSSGSTGTDAITIKNFAFAPSSVTVAPGATVTVTNKDQVAHTVTSTKGDFDTGDIGSGQSKTFTAPKTPGSYPYICSIHQYMTGTLVVSG
jgi:plastocyanin